MVDLTVRKTAARKPLGKTESRKAALPVTAEAGARHGGPAEPTEDELDQLMAAIDGHLDEIDRLQRRRG